MWRAILSGTTLTALFLIGGQITLGQQATAIKRTDLSRLSFRKWRAGT